MLAVNNIATHSVSSFCLHYDRPMEQGRPLYFCPVVSSSSFFFFPTPNLSRRRLDVCHTSTHGVALVRISDACLKRAMHTARCKYRTQKSRQKCHLGTIAQLCRAISSQLRHVSTIGKNLVKQQYVLHSPHVLIIWRTSAH